MLRYRISQSRKKGDVSKPSGFQQHIRALRCAPNTGTGLSNTAFFAPSLSLSLSLSTTSRPPRAHTLTSWSRHYFKVQSLFYQAAYQGCIDLALSSSSSNARSSDPTTISTLLYAARSHLARSPADPASALALLKSMNSSEPHVAAVEALARFVQAHAQDDADGTSREIIALTELLDHAVVGESKGEVIRCAAATALFLDGDARRRSTRSMWEVRRVASSSVWRWCAHAAGDPPA